ncbi:hypothetical protein BD410DRAFT_781103 [Rickenella mellea]|uniref:Adipose-regulatory protein n=1 Tax=Rickenella mellea TaxID=50990 RepID=A0A4Y7QNF1_9AGAM|nr:hypothetical protein BD410DRAFT_781103 [Rickenella mellea]
MSTALARTSSPKPPETSPAFGNVMEPLNAVAGAVKTKFRSLTPQLVPLAVCLGVIPILIFSSLGAGLAVWISAPSSWQAPVYLQYGDGLPPYANMLLPRLNTKQPYDITLHLNVPASADNLAIGNFMTSLSLRTSSNVTLVDVRRPSLILPPNRRFIPLTISSLPKLIEHEVPLLSSFVPRTPSVIALIEIGRRDGWKSVGHGEGRELSVWTAYIRGKIRPSGILGILARFPITVAFIASITFFILSLLVLAVFLGPAILRDFTRQQTEQNETTRSPDRTLTGRRSRSSSLGSLGVARQRESSPSTQSSSAPSPPPEPDFPQATLRVRLRRLGDAGSPDSDSQSE